MRELYLPFRYNIKRTFNKPLFNQRSIHAIYLESDYALNNVPLWCYYLGFEVIIIMFNVLDLLLNPQDSTLINFIKVSLKKFPNLAHLRAGRYQHFPLFPLPPVPYDHKLSISSYDQIKEFF